MAESSSVRPRIADIIRSSGAIGPDASGGDAMAQAAALAASLVSGTSAATFVAAESLAQVLSKRFKFSSGETCQFDVPATYEATGRALVLALRAQGCTIATAFDTASGAMLETKKAMTLVSPAFDVTIELVDVAGTTAHLQIHAQHAGIDFMHQDRKTIDALFAKTREYLAHFAS